MKSFWNFLKKNKLYGFVNLIGLTVLLIAAVSVLYQSVKTASTNPAEALKKE